MVGEGAGSPAKGVGVSGDPAVIIDTAGIAPAIACHVSCHVNDT